jgi:hypothetical protein
MDDILCLWRKARFADEVKGRRGPDGQLRRLVFVINSCYAGHLVKAVQDWPSYDAKLAEKKKDDLFAILSGAVNGMKVPIRDRWPGPWDNEIAIQTATASNQWSADGTFFPKWCELQTNPNQFRAHCGPSGQSYPVKAESPWFRQLSLPNYKTPDPGMTPQFYCKWDPNSHFESIGLGSAIHCGAFNLQKERTFVRIFCVRSSGLYVFLFDLS